MGKGYEFSFILKIRKIHKQLFNSCGSKQDLGKLLKYCLRMKSELMARYESSGQRYAIYDVLLGEINALIKEIQKLINKLL